MLGRRIKGAEVHHHNFPTSMSPYEERGLGCAIKMATDLRRKVQADVENLV